MPMSKRIEDMREDLDKLVESIEHSQKTVDEVRETVIGTRVLIDLFKDLDLIVQHASAPPAARFEFTLTLEAENGSAHVYKLSPTTLPLVVVSKALSAIGVHLSEGARKFVHVFSTLDKVYQEVREQKQAPQQEVSTVEVPFDNDDMED